MLFLVCAMAFLLLTEDLNYLNCFESSIILITLFHALKY